MGLFSKRQTEPTPKAEPVIEQGVKQEIVETNLTDKMLRVELEGDEAYVRYPEVKENGDNIRIVADGIVIAEVGKRGKARAELEPYVSRRAKAASIRVKTGDYGEYYRLRLTFETNTATITIE